VRLKARVTQSGRRAQRRRVRRAICLEPFGAWRRLWQSSVGVILSKTTTACSLYIILAQGSAWRW